MIHGFLGAGKTRFAKLLEQKYSALRFSPDEWMAQFYGTDPPEALYATYHELISQMIERYWTRSAELGLDVILDGGFWSRLERNHVRQKALFLGANVKLYKLEVSDSVAWQRISKRNEAMDGSVFISKATFESLKGRFEELQEDEEFTSISQDEL